MHRVWPAPSPEALDDLYHDVQLPDRGPGGRAGVTLGMVASVDGAAAVEGTTRRLGGEADRLAYARLREAADVVLVGAGTVRAEGYGPHRLRPGGAARRVARGQRPAAVIAVVTASLDLDPGSRLFGDPERPPLLVVPTDADEGRLARLADRADVLAAGAGEVDLAAALVALADRGLRRVLCEGGPGLNARLFADGLVDELFLTVAPTVVGADAQRIVDGAIGAPTAAELVELRVHADELLARYRFLRR